MDPLQRLVKRGQYAFAISPSLSLSFSKELVLEMLEKT